MGSFSNIPFFRILIPFVGGILTGIDFPFFSFHWLTLLSLFVLLFVISFYFKKQDVSKFLLLILTDLFLFIYGLTLVTTANVSLRPLYYGNIGNIGKETNFIAVISDLPVEKEKTIKCYLNVLEIKSDSMYKVARGTIIAYFKKSKSDTALQAGKTLLLKTTLQDIPEPKNPFEFDYKTYLYNRRIYHTTFVDSASYVELPVEHELNFVWETGLVCKKYILQSLKNSPLSPRAYAICAALLTGYDDDIDQDVIDAFSHSGTLHVLSVSGLHVGLIYLVLSFLFDFFDKQKKHKLAKFLFITAILWFFALITGFSAPVLRSVIMFNLLGLGKIYFRNSAQNQLNILLVSAFILLSYNPFFITDIGFQLSYLAMFGLIYFQPKLSNLWKPEHKLLDGVWQSITASIAATISTLPITLFYFKQFPVWFFVCNLIVVPATFVVLILTLLVVLKLNFTAIIINYIIAWLISFIDLFNSPKFGFIDNIDFKFMDLVFLSLLSVIISLALQFRSHKQLAFGLIVLICWQFFSLFDSYKLKHEKLFVVYHINKRHAFAIKNRTQTIISKIEAKDFNFHIRHHVINMNMKTVEQKKFNYLQTESENVLILNKPNYLPYTDFSQISTLIIANDFKLRGEDLIQFKSLKTLVVDGSNNNFTIKKMEELSRKFGFAFYSTKAKGAYLLGL